MKKIYLKWHLWLGMITGPLVFIISFTGVLYAFQFEILTFTQEFRKVPHYNGMPILPSEIKNIAQKRHPHQQIHSVLYGESIDAVQVIYYEFEKHYFIDFHHPESGEYLGTHDAQNGFFPWILRGHYQLWLPQKIGRPLVGIVTIVFLATLITGLLLWLPKNKKQLKERLRPTFKGNFTRKNYLFHRSFGFYCLLIGVIFSLTGLVWAFDEVRNKYFSILTYGRTFQEYSEPISKSTSDPLKNMDILFKSKYNKNNLGYFEIHFPESTNSPIVININPHHDKYYAIDYQYFDQQSLQELKVEHMWGHYPDSKSPKLLRMNYDLHTGGYFGLIGKTIAFLASLVISALPITGFVIWYKRNNKNSLNKSSAIEID